MRKERISAGEFWADKLMDLANLVSVVLVFGQLVAPKIYWSGFIMGVGFYLLLVIISNKLRR